MSRWFWHWIIIRRPGEQYLCRYLYSDHLTELYLSWMRCRHCTATTRQQRISFCIFTIRTILLFVNSCFTKKVFYISSISSETCGLRLCFSISWLHFLQLPHHREIKVTQALYTFCKDSFTWYFFFSLSNLFYFTKLLHTRIRGHILNQRLTDSQTVLCH